MLRSLLLKPTSLLALALLLVACSSVDPYLSEYVLSRPAEAELVGRYHLKWQTAQKEDPPEVQLSRVSLELRSDGTFVAENVPVWRPINDGFALDRIVSTQGRWRVESLGSVADGASFREIWGVRFDTPFGFANATGAAAPYGLLFHAGAPITGAASYYTRE
ncbi:MAG: hypothetical protein NTZ50_05750 [Chloroflexi bacterium]|nr:hypothetical protein [Chloroflexota bacterium]